MVSEGVNIYLGASALRTCLGDKAKTLVAMQNGEGGLRYSETFAMYAGVSDVEMKGNHTRFESLAIEQIEKVVAESGIDLSNNDTLLLISTTKGNIDLLAESCEPIADKVFIDVAAKSIANHFGCANEPIVISNACISGVSAFVVARWLLTSGAYNHIVIVGCDVLSEFVTSGFASFKSISGKPCRPYDAERDGLTLGEAAGAVLLTVDATKADGAKIRLAGGAISNDANHISGPSRTGDGLYFAISRAMGEAGVESKDVAFVNTHGTATRYNDDMESKAVAWAELNEKPLNSFKGYIGHTLGASGVIETIICAEELKQGYIYGTKGFANSDTTHSLCLSVESQKFEGSCCVKSASGFGGCNAAIVLDMEHREVVTPCAQYEPKVVAEYSLPQSELPFAEFIRSEFKSFDESYMKFYKMSDMCKALYVAVEHLLRMEGFGDIEPSQRAIVLANRTASLDADVAHQQVVNKHLPEGASPAIFVYTLANVAAGEMAIRHKMQGDNTFFVEGAESGLAERYGASLIERGRAEAVICGWCDYLNGEWKVNVKLIKK